MSIKRILLDSPEYIENRKHRIRITQSQKKQINIIYSYLWPHNIREGFGASRIDVRALAYGDALEIPVVTDDSDMRELASTFGIEVWSLLDLLKIMHNSERIELSDIRTLLNYLRYIRDWPYTSFEKDTKRVFRGL